MRTYCLITLLLLPQLLAHGQSSPGSTFSYFGIGKVLSKGYGHQLMQAGSGIGDRSSFSLNNLNPASYSSISYPYTFLFETGFSTAWTNPGSDNRSMDASLPYLAMGFKTGKRSGASFGMRQYSKVRYNISSSTTFSGIDGSFKINYKGSGGLSEFYLGYGYSLTNRLSAGFHASFIFGEFAHTQDISSADSGLGLSIKDQTFLSTPSMDFGIQYVIPIKNSTLTIGITYDPFSSLLESRKISIFDGASYDTTADTLTSSRLESYGFDLPNAYGFGASWVFRNRLKWYGDGSLQQWTPLNLEEKDYRLVNSYRLSAGIRKLADYNKLEVSKRMETSIGFFAEKTYLELNGTPVYTFGGTVGLEIPVRNQAKVRLIYENGAEFSNGKNAYLDSYSRITLSITMIDAWFRKPKYD